MNQNFKSKNEIKWCPGCGNYAILDTVQKTFSELNLNNKNIVFVSGIGCAGRFPYYINTYGFHTLHGRAPAVATGLKLSNKNLNIWIVIGDGDGFSIGLSHTLHLIRKNMNIKILFINNSIYSLTKGQYSPTSKKSFISKSSPFGSIEEPINPMLLAISSNVSFAARSIDSDTQTLKDILINAINHNGTSFIEIMQNCNIFNDGIYSKYSKKEEKTKNVIYIKNNEPLYFEKNNEKVLDFNNFELIIENSKEKKNLIKHNIYEENALQIFLSKITVTDNLPLPLGIIRKIERPTYEDFLKEKYNTSKRYSKIEDIL